MLLLPEPDLPCGADLLAEGRAREQVLTRDELPETFFIGNSLRGLLKARLS